MTSRKSSQDGKSSREIQEMLPYDHSAAGHEGITTDETTQMIIKPCTQTEIDFYTATQELPALQPWTPQVLGFLQQNNQLKLEELLRNAHVVHEGQNAAAFMPTIPQGLSAPTIIPTGMTAVLPDFAPASPVTTTTTSISSKRNSWKPSGGKKLETGLSIVLENLTQYFTRPNVLDIKLGKRLWADDAPPAKRKKLDDVSSKTTSGSLGLRVAGMRVWQDGKAQATPSEQATNNRNSMLLENPSYHGLPGEPNVELRDGYKCYDKNYGREFHAENVSNALITFLGGGSWSGGRIILKRKNASKIAKRFLEDVHKIEDSLCDHETRMYSASVLMVYEGDEAELENVLEVQRSKEAEEAVASPRGLANRAGDHTFHSARGITTSVINSPGSEILQESEDEEEDDDTSEPQAHIVRLIDFAHAHMAPGQGPDANLLSGLNSLIRILELMVPE